MGETGTDNLNAARGVGVTGPAGGPLAQAGRARVLFRELGGSTIRIEVFPLDGPIIVTIDGTAGTGKSTVAQRLAWRLDADFLDTGAMYRAAAAIALDEGIPLHDERRLVQRVREANIRFDWSNRDSPAVTAFGRRMEPRIREADVTAIVSPVAAIHDLREVMVELQRAIAREHPRLVTEGRDQGTVVFPQAQVKFFLDADPRERARRRAEQLRARGRPADEAQILADLLARDARDSTRADGPLRCPEDAERIDTTHLTVDGVVARLDELVRLKARSGGPPAPGDRAGG